jgi:hypothetical protein
VFNEPRPGPHIVPHVREAPEVPHMVLERIATQKKGWYHNHTRVGKHEVRGLGVDTRKVPQPC